jgi:hypothetical protein
LIINENWKKTKTRQSQVERAFQREWNTPRKGLVFKRQLVPVADRKKLRSTLARDLKRPYYFKSLAKVNRNKSSVRVIEFNGVKVVIKNTLFEGEIPVSKHEEGFAFKKMRREFLRFQKSRLGRKPERRRYIIKTPKVYCRIGNYLVMEYFEELDYISAVVEKRFEPALKQLESDLKEFSKLHKKKFKLPQFGHFFILGATNPENPTKAVIYYGYVYDYE